MRTFERDYVILATGLSRCVAIGGKGDASLGRTVVTNMIDMDNIHAVREEIAVGYLDEDTQLPLQKYHTLFKLSVLKKYDLWKNARDCGYGDFLEVIYPPLTTEEKAERQKLLKEAAGKRKSGADIEFEADDMEEDEP